jgi:hypothetical protein
MTLRSAPVPTRSGHLCVSLLSFFVFSVHSVSKLFAFSFNFELSTLKYHLRQGLDFRMRDAERNVLHSKLLRDFSCLTPQR